MGFGLNLSELSNGENAMNSGQVDSRKEEPREALGNSWIEKRQHWAAQSCLVRTETLGKKLMDEDVDEMILETDVQRKVFVPIGRGLIVRCFARRQGKMRLRIRYEL